MSADAAATAAPAYDWGETSKGVDASILSSQVWPMLPPITGNLFTDAEARQGYRGLLAAFKTFVPPAPEGVEYKQATFSRADAASPELAQLAKEVGGQSHDAGQGTVYIIQPPKDKANGAGVVFVHGGGFVGGTPQMTDALFQALAAQTGLTFFAVDYRLFPESGPWPTALLDVWAGIDWVVAHAEQYGVSKDRLGLYAQSAGGWLGFTAAAARAALTPAKHSGFKAIFGSYPALSSKISDFKSKSNPEVSQLPSFLWNIQSSIASSELLLPASAVEAVPERLRPFLAPDELKPEHLKSLSPLYILAAERDLLRDEAVDFANKAKEAGANVTLRVAPGDVHVGMECFALESAQAGQSVTELCTFLLSNLLV